MRAALPENWIGARDAQPPRLAHNAWQADGRGVSHKRPTRVCLRSAAVKQGVLHEHTNVHSYPEPRRLLVRRAAEPETIQWEHLEYTSSQRSWRRKGVTLAALLVLIVSFGCIVLADSL